MLCAKYSSFSFWTWFSVFSYSDVNKKSSWITFDNGCYRCHHKANVSMKFLAKWAHTHTCDFFGFSVVNSLTSTNNRCTSKTLFHAQKQHPFCTHSHELFVRKGCKFTLIINIHANILCAIKLHLCSYKSLVKLIFALVRYCKPTSSRRRRLWNCFFSVFFFFEILLQSAFSIWIHRRRINGTRSFHFDVCTCDDAHFVLRSQPKSHWKRNREGKRNKMQALLIPRIKPT